MSLTKRNAKWKTRIETCVWSFNLAWKIDKKMLLIWLGLKVFLSLFPAVTLGYYRDIIAHLSVFISTSSGSLSDIVSKIIILGLVLSVIGISARLNVDFLYMTVYDSYFVGMEEFMMGKAQNVSMTDLQNKDFKDEYLFCTSRGGSLTDFISGFIDFAGKLVAIGSLLIVAFTASKIIFSITFIYVIGVLFLNSPFIDKIRKDIEKVWSNERRINYLEKMPLNLGTAKEIRIYKTYEIILKQWRQAFKPIEDYENKRSYDLELRTFISGIVFYLFMVIMIVFCVFKVAEGTMTADIFLMVYTLCLSISNAVNGVTKTYLAADYGIVALERQRKLFMAAPEVDINEENKKADTPLDDDVCFEAKDLSFSYIEGKPVIKNLNLKINKGETIALVGYNGSGKSTLVKILLGLLRPSGGSLKLYGRDYDDYKRGFINSRIAAFFQDFYLFHLTLAENVGIGDVKNVNDRQRIVDAVNKGGAKTVADKLPKGLDSLLRKMVDKKGAELSGGQGQRVAVSRAHMSDKEIMIFDEPASMLDPIAEMEQFLSIKGKLNGRTAILISHRVGFARLADRIIFMEKGRIVEDGSHEELMSKNGAYAEFFNHQAEWYDNTSVKKVSGGIDCDEE